MIIKDINRPLSSMDSNKESLALNKILDKMDLIDMYYAV